MLSDWSKTHVLPEYKTWETHFLLFLTTLPLYHKTNEEAKAVYYTVIKHSQDLRTPEKINVENTHLGVFSHSVIHSLGFFIC